MKAMVRPGIDTLIQVISPSLPLYIHTHDFPDHDAVASAYALSILLAKYDIHATVSYSGDIQSYSLEHIIDLLEIPIHALDMEQTEPIQIIAIDGISSKIQRSPLAAHIIAFIDHHAVLPPDQYKYMDVRTEYGACSTIIWDYYRQAGLSCEKNIATILLLGIMMDTAFMTRSVTQSDLAAFNELFFTGDWKLASRVLRNSLSFADATVFQEAIEVCVVEQGVAFIMLKKKYISEVIALVADFFLGFREFNFVLVCARTQDEYRISVRSENYEWRCNQVLQTALKGIGTGGGHAQMGGGSIMANKFPGEETLRQRFLTALKEQT